MLRKSNVRDSIIQILDKWLEFQTGSASKDRESVLSAREKRLGNLQTLSSEEADAVIDCMMEEIDVESEQADEIVDLVLTMTSPR